MLCVHDLVHDHESVYSQLFLHLFHRMLQNYEYCEVGSPTVSLSSIIEHFETEKNSFNSGESLTSFMVAKVVSNVWGSKVSHKRTRLSRGGKPDRVFTNLRRIDVKDRLRVLTETVNTEKKTNRCRF